MNYNFYDFSNKTRPITIITCKSHRFRYSVNLIDLVIDLNTVNSLINGQAN